MKKIALMLALVLVMSASMCVFASADPAISAKPVIYYGLDENGNVNQTDATNADNDQELTGPSDMIAIAYEFDTDGTGFAGYNFVLNYDATKFNLLGIDYDNWALTADSDVGQVWCKSEVTSDFGTEPFGATAPVVDKLAYDLNNGRVSTAHGQASNYKNKGKNITSGNAFIIYLEPITSEACDTVISASYMEIALDDAATKYTCVGESVTVKLNGGAPEAAAPVVSLGAKVNATITGLRFGATYNKIEENGIVNDLGMLLLPTAKLGENTLDLDFAAANALVAKVRARSIEGYVEGYSFEDYATFNFYVTLLGLEGHEDADIAAVPYIVYDDGTVIYADQMVHSFNSASEAAA